MPDDSTVSLVESPTTGESRRDGERSLVLVLNAARPCEPPTRIRAADVDEIELGRGADLQIDAATPRRLRVDLPDRVVSSVHARISRDADGWQVRDEKSRNGTLINGRRIESAPLGDEDVLEIGNCFFVVRERAVSPGDGPDALRTLSAALAQELDVVKRLAPSSLPILIGGETGTGKEVLARTVHELSGRSGPFVAVNCGAIPPTLIESELFGARRGAYSGASEDRRGVVAEADKGTLLLDEIAELPGPSQAALLRFLQEGEVRPLGAGRASRVDVRVLAATNRSLEELVAAGRFRHDLYARLRGHVVILPPLRSRREDMGLLIATLLQRAAGARAMALRFQRAAARALLGYAWPDNVRELEQVLTRAVALVDGDEISIDCLPAEVTERSSAPPSAREERLQLVELLRKHAGNVSAVARALSTSRTQVQRLLERHGLDAAAFRER